MRVMIFTKATEESENGGVPSAEVLDALMKYNEDLVNAGIMLGGAGLKPSREGKRVHFDGTNRTVIDGPFSETRELETGYWLWEVKNMDEAVEWVKRCPNLMLEPSAIEIRPLYQLEDFGDSVTPEVLERDERIRQKIEQSDHLKQ